MNCAIASRRVVASAVAGGSHDVRVFQRVVISRRISAAKGLATVHVIKESTLDRDKRDNPALLKVQDTRRIHALRAAVIATGLAETEAARLARRFRRAVAGSAGTIRSGTRNDSRQNGGN